MPMREGARLLRPVGEKQVGRKIASRRVCPADFWMRWGRTIAIPRSGTKAALGLSQRRALILVLVLSFALCAGIWVTVALLSVAGGDDLG
jgi:hypothetical protein